MYTSLGQSKKIDMEQQDVSICLSMEEQDLLKKDHH